MKTICICEKPSVARSIARVLGVTEKQEGYLSGNGYACLLYTSDAADE